MPFLHISASISRRYIVLAGLQEVLKDIREQENDVGTFAARQLPGGLVRAELPSVVEHSRIHEHGESTRATLIRLT